MSRIYTTKETITIPFPKEKFVTYLNEVGASSEKELTFSTVVKLMICIIADFKRGTISLDELSEIFGFLAYDGFFRKQPDALQNRFGEIGNVLESGSELGYYLRHAVDNGEPDSMFVQFFFEVLHFYDVRDTILANVEEMETRGK